MVARLQTLRRANDDDPIRIELRIEARRQLTADELKETVAQVAMTIVDERYFADVVAQLFASQPIRIPPAKKLKRVK